LKVALSEDLQSQIKDCLNSNSLSAVATDAVTLAEGEGLSLLTDNAMGDGMEGSFRFF
jgi:hypothetical protein